MTGNNHKLEDVYALVEKIAIRVDAIASSVDALKNAAPTRQTAQQTYASVTATAQALGPATITLGRIESRVERIESQMAAIRNQLSAAAQKLTGTYLGSKAGLWTLIDDVQSEVQVGPLGDLIATFAAWRPDEQDHAHIRVVPSGPTLFPSDIRELAAIHDITQKKASRPATPR